MARLGSRLAANIKTKKPVVNFLLRSSRPAWLKNLLRRLYIFITLHTRIFSPCSSPPRRQQHIQAKQHIVVVKCIWSKIAPVHGAISKYRHTNLILSTGFANLFSQYEFRDTATKFDKRLLKQIFKYGIPARTLAHITIKPCLKLPR